MKVAFWSGFGMDTGGTLHIAAISIILASLYHEEVVLGSNYVSSYMLNDCFFGAILQHRRRKRPYRYCYGEPNYFRNLWDIYKKDIISTPMEGITIIRPPDITDKSMFYYEVSEKTLFFMDVAPESNLVFGSILEEADIVVSFLPQDSIKIQIFFEHYSSLIPKSLFIIDDFRKNGGCIPKNLSVKYRITPAKKKKLTSEPAPDGSYELITVLTALRNKIADAEHLPRFQILSNAVLQELADKMPETPEEAAKISGIGPVKLRRIIPAMLEAIRLWKLASGSNNK